MRFTLTKRANPMEQTKDVTFMEALNVQKWVLIKIGAWPDENPSKFYTARKIFCWIVNICFTGLLVNALRENMHDFSRISEVVYILGAEFCAVLKMIMLHRNRRVFLEMHRKMNDSTFSSSDRKYINGPLRRFSNIVTMLTRMSNITMTTLVLLYGGFPLVDNKPLFTYIEMKNKTVGRALFFFQWIGMVVGGAHTCGMDTLLFGLMSLTAAYLEALNNKLINLKNAVDIKEIGRDLDEAQKDEIICAELRKCVVYHMKIIRLVACSHYRAISAKKMGPSH